MMKCSLHMRQLFLYAVEKKNYQETHYHVFFGSYIGNYYLVMFFPDIWRYELFETYMPNASWNISKEVNFSTDYESYNGRKNSAIFHPAEENSGYIFLVNSIEIPAKLEFAEHKKKAIQLDNGKEKVKDFLKRLQIKKRSYSCNYFGRKKGI